MPSSENFRGCPTARFLQKVDRQGDCLVWTGGVSGSGYGNFWFRRSLWRAHRAALALFGRYEGPLHVDHLCRNRLCVNPDHLEPVTQAENNQRANAVRWARDGGVCKRGHELTEDNVYIRSDGRGRTCRTCAMARSRGELEYQR